MSVILAIESSCDETACAIIKDGNQILSNVVSTQIATHKKYGGVVPEVASRLHVENITLVLEEAMNSAEISMKDVDAIGFTLGPGLIGSLHVGNQAAKTLAMIYDKPLVPIHHITGHIYANKFVDDIIFPALALVISGGHTELVYMKADYQFEILGSTDDDAIGEAYDKVARVLGLPYPGGPEIDRLAKSGKANYKLKIPKVEGKYDFSFSGLKSSVLQLIARLKRNGEEVIDADVAYAFQETALDSLIIKTCMAIEEFQPKHLLLAGGVAANSRLREKMVDVANRYPQTKVTIPPIKYCTDNAAMIGASAEIAYNKGVRCDYNASSDSSMDLLSY
jgi:N6-L-threonylcarbamoyladenine synthase